MKTTFLLLSTVLTLLGLGMLTWAQCPEDPNDNGICDTMYVEGYPPDLLVSPPGPHIVRLPIYVTHDVPNPSIDSLAGMVIPLCYEHTNSSKYCSLSGYWNNTALYPQPNIERSIFRHYIEGGDTLIHNWMMDLSTQPNGGWDFISLNLDGTSHFWLSLIRMSNEQAFEEGSRVLLATMTFRVEDTTTITIDSCFYPPAAQLAFYRSDLEEYIPRHFLPVTQPIATPLPSQVVINEVMFFPDTTDTVHERNHEWVELYNSGPTINLGNWVISNRDASQDVILPSTYDFPTSAYLVVHFTTGTNDYDFSDGEGDYYAGNADVFSETMDECALYTAPDPFAIIDLVNWSETRSYTPGSAHDAAVSVGIWTSGDFFTPIDTADLYSEAEVDWVPPGESMGRDSSSTDSDTPGDWAVFGGADAIYATPGKVNYQLLQNIPPPKGEEIEGRYAAWTVMFYLNGDNNLDNSYFGLLDRMEKQGSLPNVNVVVLADFRNTIGGKTLRGLLQANNELGTIRLPEMIPSEKNMGSPQTLGEFIHWAQQTYWAGKYVLFIKDHGAGWKGLSRDETSGNDRIYMQELKSALDYTIPPKLDVVVFDACKMAMVEVANQVRQRVEMMVASEEIKYPSDFPYDSIFATMNANPYWTGEQLALDIVAKAKANAIATRSADSKKKYTFSATDCRNLSPLIGQIDEFGEELKLGVNDFRNYYDRNDNVQLHIRTQLSLTEHFKDANFIDLYHFAQLIKADGDIPDKYKTQAPLIIQSLQKGGSIIKAEEHGDDHNPNAHGLSIYFPSAQTKAVPPIPKGNTPDGERPYDDPQPSHLPDNSNFAKYAFDPNDCKPRDLPCVNDFNQAKIHPYPPTPGFDFVEDTWWDEFLHRYYEPVADAGKDTSVKVGESAHLNAVGSSDAERDANGSVERYIWDYNSRVDDPPPCPPSPDEDWDKDCWDEANDDNTSEGMEVAFPCVAPGIYYITLTVWNDHHLRGGTHTEHFETDQDEVVVRCKCDEDNYTLIPPIDVIQHENGSYESDLFVACDGTGHNVISVDATFTGTGIANFQIIFTTPPPGPWVEGFVRYEVVDHCQPGGDVALTAMNDIGESVDGSFAITLNNNPPTILCPPDTIFEYTDGYTGVATALDEDNDYLVFSKLSGPDSLVVSPVGVITWETDSGDVGGPYDVMVIVTDTCGATAECIFQLMVTAPKFGCCQLSPLSCMPATEQECSAMGGAWFPPPATCIDYPEGSFCRYPRPNAMIIQPNDTSIWDKNYFSDTLTIKAIDFQPVTAMYYTVFEYFDGAHWQLIDTDYDGTTYMRDPWDTLQPGGDGWQAKWRPPNDLLEGYYMIRATMVDSGEFFSADTIVQYWDPSPPEVTISWPPVFNFPTEDSLDIHFSTPGDNVTEMLILVYPVTDYPGPGRGSGGEKFDCIQGYNKGVPHINQHDVYPNGTDGRNRGCSPTSMAACLKYWSQNGYPCLTNNGTMTDAQMTNELAGYAGTRPNSGTAPGREVGAIDEYIRRHCGECKFKPVVRLTGRDVTIRRLISELFEEDEDVITGDDRHVTVVNSFCVHPKRFIDYMDPWTGTEINGDFDVSKGFQGRPLLDLIIVSPKETTVVVPAETIATTEEIEPVGPGKYHYPWHPDPELFPVGHGYLVNVVITDALGHKGWDMVKVELFVRGDASGDGIIDVGDVLCLINYLFKTSIPPFPLDAGDADCDGIVDIGDIICLINYLFKGGNPPGCD